MFPIHSELATRPFPWSKCMASRLLWLLGALALIHLISFIPAYYAQESFHAKSEEFKEVWNSGGAMSLAAQGIDPTKQEEQTRRHAYVATYMNHSFFYRVWMVPDWATPISFALAWVFQPGWFSLLLSIWVLFYAGFWLEKKWKKSFTLLAVIGVSVLSSLLYYLLMSSILDLYPEVPFCGISAGTAFVMGALMKLHRDPVPFRYWWRGWKSKRLHPLLFGLIWLVLDVIVQLFINPINYGWAFVLDLLAVGAGFGLAPLIPQLPAPKITRRIVVNPSEQIRAHLDEGWRLCDLLELEAALGEFNQAITLMLRPSKPDSYLVDNTFTRLLQGKNPLPVSPELWYEWGTRLAEKKFAKFAVECLEQAYKAPGASSQLARPAVVQSAELRIQNRMDPASCKPWLERVVKLRSDDLMGRRAATLLEQIG